MEKLGRPADQPCPQGAANSTKLTEIDERSTSNHHRWIEAKAFSLAILQWTPERTMDGADAIELEHQRRMVSLRADGVIAILCPVASDTVAGIAIMTVPAEEAAEIMAEDPCVRAGMMRCDVHPCHGFPGDALPA